MRDLDDLRRAFAAETADLYLDLPTDTIRRRARRVRTRRTALGAAAVALALVLAVPMAVLAGGADRGERTARPAPSCVPPGSPVRSEPVTWLGTPGDTGLTAGPDDDLHDVRVGLTGAVERPSLLIEYRSRATGVPTYPHELIVGRTVDGDILLDGATSGVKLVNVEITLRDVVFYLGLYAGTRHSVTIDVNGRETAVSTLWNDPTGWTIFWDDRKLPPPVEDDRDAPGTRPAVTVRFNVYDGSTRLLSQAAMPGVSDAPLGGRSNCTG